MNEKSATKRNVDCFGLKTGDFFCNLQKHDEKNNNNNNNNFYKMRGVGRNGPVPQYSILEVS